MNAYLLLNNLVNMIPQMIPNLLLQFVAEERLECLDAVFLHSDESTSS